MAIFKRKHLVKILAGQKIQTRRIHRPQSQGWQVGRTYAARDTYYSKAKARITIMRRFRQRLADITSEDVRKEGYENLKEFKSAWQEIYGSWNPEQIVTAYEFKLQKIT